MRGLELEAQMGRRRTTAAREVPRQLVTSRTAVCGGRQCGQIPAEALKRDKAGLDLI